MAVYTEVSDTELAAFIADYDIGPAISCKGIAEGVENSNYLLLTEGGPHILTLYEKRVAAQDLPFFLGLIEHLAARGVPCPVPVHGRDGAVLRQLCGRPAAITSFLAGVWLRRPQPATARRWARRWRGCTWRGWTTRRSVPMRSRSTAGGRSSRSAKRAPTASFPASRPRSRRRWSGSRRNGRAICRAA